MCMSVSKQEHWGEVDTPLSHTLDKELFSRSQGFQWSKMSVCEHACVLCVCLVQYTKFPLPLSTVGSLVSFPEWEDFFKRIQVENFKSTSFPVTGTCEQLGRTGKGVFAEELAVTLLHSNSALPCPP